MKDCDGDGIADPTCKDSSGNFGVLQSSKGCADSWPRGTCNPEGNLFHFFYISKKFVIFHHFVYSIQLVLNSVLTKTVIYIMVLKIKLILDVWTP